MADGPAKTARLAAWVQGLYEGLGSAPILVGGAVVELITGGAYTTGDLDFAGTVPKEIDPKSAVFFKQVTGDAVLPPNLFDRNLSNLPFVRDTIRAWRYRGYHHTSRWASNSCASPTNT